jgi:hypothetical protein
MSALPMAKDLRYSLSGELAKVVTALVAEERDQSNSISDLPKSLLAMSSMGEDLIVALDSTKSMERIARTASNKTRLIGVIEMDDRASCFRPETGFSSATPTQSQNYCAL